MQPIDSWKNETYAYCNGVFNEKEIFDIINIGKKLNITEGVVGAVDSDEFIIRKNTRDSRVSWIHNTDDTSWVWDRISNTTSSMNKEFFQFDLSFLEHAMQYTEYDSRYKGFYGPHIDRGYDKLCSRKLSCVVQLSDPSEYEGGELLLYGNGIKEPLIAPKIKGTIIFFPSFVIHEVTPVTKGNRKSLVTWIHGPRFR